MSRRTIVWPVAVAGAAIAILAFPAAALPASAVDATPTATGTPSASATVAATVTPQASAGAAARPRTNLQAVVDPVAVPVRDGVRVRVGIRNAGPRSITAPVGVPAASFTLHIVYSIYINRVRSLGGCAYQPETPPHGDPPVIDFPVSFFNCQSGRTLRAGATYWQSFIFPDLSGFRYGVWLDSDGYADDPVGADNSRNVVVRLGGSGDGPGLPITGVLLVPLVGGGLALILVGVLAFLPGRRRRVRFTAG